MIEYGAGKLMGVEECGLLTYVGIFKPYMDLKFKKKILIWGKKEYGNVKARQTLLVPFINWQKKVAELLWAS